MTSLTSAAHGDKRGCTEAKVDGGSYCIRQWASSAGEIKLHTQIDCIFLPRRQLNYLSIADEYKMAGHVTAEMSWELLRRDDIVLPLCLICSLPVVCSRNEAADILAQLSFLCFLMHTRTNYLSTVKCDGLNNAAFSSRTLPNMFVPLPLFTLLRLEINLVWFIGCE